jgi:hypothetical protein
LRQRQERRGEEAVAGEDNAGRCDGMDQAQQEVRRVHGSEEAGEKTKAAKKFKSVRVEKKAGKKKARAGGRR